MRGRKPLPTALKVLTGNPGHRAKADLGRGEPNPEVMLGEPPAKLNAVGRAYWETEGNQLLKTRVITAADQSAFGDLCFYVQLQEAESETINRLSAKKDRTAKEENALSAAHNRHMKLTDRIQKIRTEFGMTPASRTKVKTDPTQGELPLGENITPFDQARKLASGI